MYILVNARVRVCKRVRICARARMRCVYQRVLRTDAKYEVTTAKHIQVCSFCVRSHEFLHVCVGEVREATSVVAAPRLVPPPPVQLLLLTDMNDVFVVWCLTAARVSQDGP